MIFGGFMKRILVVLLTITCILQGCSINNHKTDNSNTSVDCFENAAISSNVITWGIPDAYTVNENAVQRINQILYKRGYDFALKIIPLSLEKFEEAIAEYEEKEGSLDIASLCTDSSYSNKNEPVERIRSGYFMNLEDYLFSEAGKTIYEYLSMLQWDSVRCDNQIYTFPNEAANTGFGVYYIFNPEYFSEDDIKDITPNIDTIKELVADKKVDFTPIVCDIGSEFVSLLGYYTIGGTIISKDTGIACSYLDNEKVYSYMNTMNKLYVNKIVTNDFNQVLQGNYLVYMSSGTFASSCIPRTLIKYQSYAPVSTSLNFTNGITAASKHQKEALELLTLAYTDSEIANLLIYGIEGEDYVLNNGHVSVVDENSQSSYIKQLMLGIYDPAYPDYLETDITNRHESAQEYYKSCTYSDLYIGFIPDDYDKFMSKYNIFYTSLQSYSELWTNDDFENNYNAAKAAMKNDDESKYICTVNEILQGYKNKAEEAQ